MMTTRTSKKTTTWSGASDELVSDPSPTKGPHMIKVYDEIANWYRTKRHLTQEVTSADASTMVQAICSRQVYGMTSVQFDLRRQQRGAAAIPVAKPWAQIPFCLTCLRTAVKNPDLHPGLKRSIRALIENKGVPLR
jgi:hypothetical protein